MDMTPERWEYTGDYLREVFGGQDDHLAGLMKDAVEAGLPDIAISGDVGRLLMILTSMTRARLGLEIGTLGGYSGIWIARGLRDDGRLITIEKERNHAEFALKQFRKAGVGGKIDLRQGDALKVLPELTEQAEERSVDVVFIDAVKTDYPQYWALVRPLIAVGGLILADNVLGAGDWWIDCEDHPERIGADRFNRLVADDPDFQAVAVPIRQGVLIGRRVR